MAVAGRPLMSIAACQPSGHPDVHMLLPPLLIDFAPSARLGESGVFLADQGYLGRQDVGTV